jgi:NodT family efflux transporter outer membrane factor (OMF) lipoprotein
LTKTRLLAATLLAPILLGAGALAGCKAVGPDFQSPAAPTAPGYLMQGDAPSDFARLSPDRRAAGAWWKSFGSADLDRVMDQALSGNQTVGAANASLVRSLQEAAATRGAQQPQIDVNGGLQGTRINLTSFGFTGSGVPGVTITNPTLGLYSIGGTVSYDADLFGGLRRNSEAAAARAENQAHQADAAYLTLTGQTAMAAMQIATVRAEMVVTQMAIDEDARVVALIHEAEGVGGEAPAATTSARAQLAADEAQIPPLQQQLAQARHQLAQLVGQAPADWSAPDFDLASFSAPAEVPVSLPSGLVRRRPDILAAEADVHVATAQLGVATAALYPDLRLTANITQTAIPPASLLSYGASGWTLAAGLTQPIWHGGTLKANKRAAEATANEALLRYHGTVVAAFTQVADVMSAITQDDAELAALAKSEEVAEAALRDDENAFRLGGGALLPVLDDERRLQMARRARVAAQGRRLADIAELYVATAADWRDAKS